MLAFNGAVAMRLSVSRDVVAVAARIFVILPPLENLAGDQSAKGSTGNGPKACTGNRITAKSRARDGADCRPRGRSDHGPLAGVGRVSITIGGTSREGQRDGKRDQNRLFHPYTP